MLGLGNNISSSVVSASKFSNFVGSFDGTADFVKTTNDSSINPTAAISISVWAKPNAWDMTNSGNDDYFIGCIASGGYGVLLSNSGSQITTIKFVIKVSDSDPESGGAQAGYLTATINEATTEALTGWNHIVATYDGETARLYLNGGTTGVTNATGAASSTIVYNDSERPVMLGADNNNSTTAGQHFYHGLLDDVAVWDAVLDADAVTAVYNTGVPFDLTQDNGNYDNSGDLQGYWKFEEGTGTEVADSSTNSNTGVVGNAWSWSTDAPE